MMDNTQFSILIAKELDLSPTHVANVVKLLGEGATIPFIARYRKEMTGTMNDYPSRDT